MCVHVCFCMCFSTQNYYEETVLFITIKKSIIVNVFWKKKKSYNFTVFNFTLWISSKVSQGQMATEPQTIVPAFTSWFYIHRMAHWTWNVMLESCKKTMQGFKIYHWHLKLILELIRKLTDNSASKSYLFLSIFSCRKWWLRTENVSYYNLLFLSLSTERKYGKELKFCDFQ